MNALELLEKLRRESDPAIWIMIHSRTVFNLLPELIAVVRDAEEIEGHESLCETWTQKDKCNCGFRKLMKSLDALEAKAREVAGE